MPAPILSAYTASKFAVKGFTDSLRLELMHDKAPVSVTMIKPSGIHTTFGDHAENYMDAASRVLPPVYAPEIVADEILHAAANPTRYVLVGVAGRARQLLVRLAPLVFARPYAFAFVNPRRYLKT